MVKLCSANSKNPRFTVIAKSPLNARIRYYYRVFEARKSPLIGRLISEQEKLVYEEKLLIFGIKLNLEELFDDYVTPV